MPSLYESTVNTGEVASSNFTTLYNASGLSVPNAGAGQITGNLNVGGNLTVQGTSLLIGDVTLQSTLSLPNYTFPVPDGTTDQVLTTDGNGNLYWIDVTAIPGAAYSISATAATGGANLTLEDSAGGTDSVKFAAGTNMNIVRTDANTITISTVADNIPDGTAQGQVLYWNGSAWTANNVIASSASADRLVAQYNNSSSGTNNALFLRKNYGATAYNETNNDGVGLGYSVISDSQGLSSYGVVTYEYSPTDPQFFVVSSTNNFATAGNTLLKLQKSTADIYAPNITLNAYQTGTPTLNATITAERGSSTNATITWNEATDTWDFTNSVVVASDLAVNGGDITTVPGGIANLYNNNAVDTINIGNSVVTEVNIGNTSGSRVQIKSPTIVGANATQSVFNTVATTVNAFGASTATNIGASTGTTTLGNNLDVKGETVRINSDNTAADSYLYMKGSNEYLKWDNTNTRFELSDQLYITQTDIPAVLERRTLSSDISPYEQKSGVKLLNRVTDAANNNTVTTGPCVLFGRTSGATDPTERIFATMGSSWNGSNQTASLSFNWSSDNFAETSPGVFPNTYQLLSLDSNRAYFQNNSIYVDYSTAGAAKIGINTSTPGYTLDVAGEANIQSVLTVQADAITVNSDKTDLDVYVNFGRAAPSANAAIRWNATSDSFEWSSGDGTWHDFIDATLTAPFYNGQLLSYLNGEWINDNKVTTTDANERNVFSYRPLSPLAGPNTSLFLRKDYSNAAPGTSGVGTYANGAGTGIAFGVQSDTQGTPAGTANSYAFMYGVYDSTNPYFQYRTSIDGGTTLSTIADVSSTAINYKGTTLTLDAYNAGTANNSTIVANRGSSGTDATIGWEESNNFWRVSNNLYADNYVIGGVGLATNGNDIFFNNENTSPAGDCNLQVKAGVSAGVNANFRWNDTTKRWQDTTNGSTYLNLPNQNLDTTDAVLFSEVSVDGVSTYNSQTTTTTSTTATAISSTTRLSQKAIIRIIDNVTGEIHMLEALAFYKGTTAYLTTYAEMYTSAALATFTADVSGGAVRILATPASANSTTFTVARISLS